MSVFCFVLVIYSVSKIYVNSALIVILHLAYINK